MTRTHHLATAALALGALAATSLQTTPAVAFPGSIAVGSDSGSIVHTVKNKGFSGSASSRPVPPKMGGYSGPKLHPTGNQPNPTRPALNKFDPSHPSVDLAQDGAYKPELTGSQANPNTIGASGGRKLPPIGGSQPNPNTVGGYGGTKLPPIGGSLPNPNGPGGNPGGGNLPPIGGSIPNPNLPGGKVPGKAPGIPVGGAIVAGGYDGHPCWWLKRNYHHTGRVYWLNRYRFCLWRHAAY